MRTHAVFAAPYHPRLERLLDQRLGTAHVRASAAPQAFSAPLRLFPRFVVPVYYYHEWNRRFLARCFQRAARHRLVRLRVEEELLAELGGSKDNLVSAVLHEIRARALGDAQELGLAQFDEWNIQVGNAG